MQFNNSVFLQPAHPVPIVLKALAQRPLLYIAASLNKLQNAPCSFVNRSANGTSECRLHIHLPTFNGRRPIKPLLRGQRRLKRAAFQNIAAMRRKKHPLECEIQIANARAKIFRYPSIKNCLAKPSGFYKVRLVGVALENLSEVLQHPYAGF